MTSTVQLPAGFVRPQLPLMTNVSFGIADAAASDAEPSPYYHLLSAKDGCFRANPAALLALGPEMSTSA